ncbi:unnamed protein product [Leuciscus chuanchicus]
MSLNSKNSSLRILNVDISDSGLYYCGWHNRVFTFDDGKNLDITGFITSAAVVQKKVLETFAAGETITLECLISEDHENYFSWFKQSLGEAPTCILSLYTEALTPTFYGDFKNDTRLTAVKKNNNFTLIIKDLKPSDTGIYYCGARDYEHITFGNGLFLNYKGVNTRHHIKQFLSGVDLSTGVNEHEFNPGDSVNLHCTVLTERCEGNHSVYWFRQESGDTHPGILYKHGNRNDQCNKSSEKAFHTQSCIYNLPNLSLTDAGTYYCAVAMCGEILFGNGSRIDIGGCTRGDKLRSGTFPWKKRKQTRD